MNEQATPKSSKRLFFKQLFILLWKSLIVRKVHFISTFFELIGPILILFSIAYLVTKMDHKDHSHQKANDIHPSTIYENPQFEIDLRSNYTPWNKMQIFYTPNQDFCRELVQPLIDSQFEVKACENVKEIQDNLKVASDPMFYQFYPFALGIQCYNFNFSGNFGKLEYQIMLPIRQWHRQDLNPFPFKNSPKPVDFDARQYSHSIHRPFAQVISRISRQFVRKFSHKPNIDLITINRMPYPEYKNPIFTFSIYPIIALGILTSYVLICPLIVKRITDEKSSKSKEMLRMIGMSDLVFWTSHFINHFMVLIFHFLIFLAIMYGYGTFPLFVHTQPLILLAVLIMFGIQMILFSMTITTVFNRPVLAVIVTIILWIAATSTIFQQLEPEIANPNSAGNSYNGLRLFTSFFPFASLIWCFAIIGSLEDLNTGINFTNLNSKASLYGDLTLPHCMLAMLASYFIYIFLIWYLDNVWPWQHGVPKSPFFLFKKSYWFPDQKQERLQKPELNKKMFEPDPVGLHPDIEIQNVTKIFKPNKIAVDHLWLDIYKNQLTVLLGHNGAGKSTLMNMITGLFKATKGQIFVNGYNVFINTNQARRNIGLCPQENILFNELTVFQHLKLYAVLKNHSLSTVPQEVKRVLDLLKLSDKKDVLGINLSGGMKRKLQLGMALIGDTRILILDEPTSGLDPEARRVVWDLLISLRREKTILLTTHYMEEADVLGDRIAIMSEGKLCCSGSPFFLKNAFGTGYQLTVEKSSKRFDAKEFLKVIQQYIPTAMLKSEIETEVIYNFGEKSQDKAAMLQNLPSLFENIESKQKEYEINSFGLTYSTLEDVFIAVDSKTKIFATSNDEDEHNSVPKLDQQFLAPKLTKSSQMITGYPLASQQFLALLIKRFHYTKRHWQMFVLQILIPSIIIAFALLVQQATLSIVDETNPPIEYNLKTLYGSGMKTYYQGPRDFLGFYQKVNSRFEAIVENVPETENFTKLILENNDNLNDFIHKVAYGLQMTNTSADRFDVWFNAEQTHSIPLSLLALFESLLEAIVPNNSISINVSLQPFEIPENNTASSETTNPIAAIITTWTLTCLFFLPIAFPFLSASYILFPINERVSKAKLMQLMTGLSPTLFWISNFVFDLVCHLAAITILYLIIYAFDTKSIIFDSDSKSSAGVLFVLLLGFGMATIPFSYIFSFIFNLPSSGFVYTVLIYLIFGLIANIFWSICDLLNNYFQANVIEWNVHLLPIVRFVPIFSMLFGYQKLYKANSFDKICIELNEQGKLETICNKGYVSEAIKGCCPNLCEKDDSCYDSGSFSFQKFGSGWEITYLFISGLIYLSLIIIYENYKQFIHKLWSAKKLPSIRTPDEDSDVSDERNRIGSLLISDQRFQQDQLLVHDLTKKFGNLTAVDHISFGVRHEECFGLLGINGAGKTTTFSMLTGDLFPTDGEAWMEGDISLRENLHEFRQNIGYCPQFDCLLDNLTGEEMLYLVASLRGIPRSNIPYDVAELVKMVGLQAHVKKTTQTYSGGNKRKLSIALSLLGNPPLVFLDEPTAGVDPVARRKIWKTLELIKNNFNCAIILTSHSMEECEALCSRLAIMVRGRFCCLGSVQHLRQKYGKGFTIVVRLKRQYENDRDYNENVKRRIMEAIPSASLKDSHQCLLQFHVADKSIRWSMLFRIMASLSEGLAWEDYIISGTTLESIFIAFARGQQRPNPQKQI